MESPIQTTRFSHQLKHPLSARVIVLLALLITPTRVMANTSSPSPSWPGCGQNPLVESVGLVLGGTAGAALIGGGMAGWGLASIHLGGCQGVGCEGPAGLLLLSPFGAVAGALGGGLVGYIIAVASLPLEGEPGTRDRDIEDDLE